MVTGFIALFVALFALVVVGRLGLVNVSPEPNVSQEPTDWPVAAEPRGKVKLFVLVHGLDQGKDWPGVNGALQGHGELLKLRYPASVTSNADPLLIASEVARAVDARYDPRRHESIVLVGQSIGALIVRRAFLIAEKEHALWPDAVTRVVLLAGMNRGWDITGRKTSDMRLDRWLEFWVGSWFARLTGIGKLVSATETGAPFVANLRLDWMKRFQDVTKRPLEVVQLLGDIDDVVSDEDNKDLRSMASPRFAWIRVRGTGHADIGEFLDQTKFGDVDVTLGNYRKAKFLLAATQPFDAVHRENEEQPFQTDPEVGEVVFVLHGIRDLGQWAVAFEQVLLGEFKKRASGNKLAVVSIRYGFFGMGPFLLRPGRDRYVKWFMDEYTETLARYPNARRIHFVGHSNGTYLLAAALERYSSLKVDRVVLGGSVVRKDYDWTARFGNSQVEYVRNYVGADDWVVALFPRFFEPPLMRLLLGNDIGSAGFNGFDDQHPALENVRYVTGGHAAFLERIHEITSLLLSPVVTRIADDAERRTGDQVRVLKYGSEWGNWLVVWPFLVAVVLFVGWHMVVSAIEPRWPMLVAYLAIVLVIFKAA